MVRGREVRLLHPLGAVFRARVRPAVGRQRVRRVVLERAQQAGQPDLGAPPPAVRRGLPLRPLHRAVEGGEVRPRCVAAAVQAGRGEVLRAGEQAPRRSGAVRHRDDRPQHRRARSAPRLRQGALRRRRPRPLRPQARGLLLDARVVPPGRRLVRQRPDEPVHRGGDPVHGLQAGRELRRRLPVSADAGADRPLRPGHPVVRHRRPATARTRSSRDYFNQAKNRRHPKEVTVDNRCGNDIYDFTTPEYSVEPDINPAKWEATRGIGRSFGYNAEEGPADYLIGRRAGRLVRRHRQQERQPAAEHRARRPTARSPRSRPIASARSAPGCGSTARRSTARRTGPAPRTRRATSPSGTPPRAGRCTRRRSRGRAPS